MSNPTSAQANWVYYAAVIAVSVAYYALYLNVGFSPADDGNYAQIAYELHLGTAAEDLTLSYGLVWFQIGTVLFDLFGPSFVSVKLIFFTAITLTNILLFYTVFTMTRSHGLATAATAVTLMVPTFPATAFYGLCILMNAAAQMRLASKMSQATARDTFIVGAALSASFLIRPDFGYIWALPLILLGGFLAFRTDHPEGLLRLANGLIAGFIAVQVPALLIAWGTGVISAVTQPYFTYPAMMADYALTGVEALFGGNAQELSGAGATTLQRPPLSAMFSFEDGRTALAVLIYAPLVFIFLTVGVIGKILFKTAYGIDTRIIAKILVALFAAGAAFPHYFFYRPDLSHVANFMPGFMVLAAALVWQLKALTRNRVAVSLLVGALTFHLGLYVWVGVQTQGTGSIAVKSGRTESFVAVNGVNTRVSDFEKQQYEFLRDVIAKNSTPGEPIVCVPYCPGIAFMTARRMLFTDFYVDDSTPIRDPLWVSNAIARTRSTRPPVVIVMDWAINGTEISRFDNWASEYVDVLKEISTEQIAKPGLTVYLL